MAGHAKRKNRVDSRGEAIAAEDAGRGQSAKKEPAAKKPAAKQKPRVKDYRRLKSYKLVRESLIEQVMEAGGMDPIRADRIEEIMDLWCQRQLLRDDVRRRGPTVLDDRGRESENRCISLGLQVSKQILELYKALGLVVEPVKAVAGRESTEDEEDEL